MSFGGASPGMSILIGVARGVAEDDKRRREMEQEAINKRLKEQQITQMEETSALAKEREQRMRDTEIARQEALEETRQVATAQREQEEAERNQFADLLAGQYMAEDGVDEMTARTRALMDLEDIDWNVTDPDQEVSIRDQAFLEDRNIEAEMEADMERVFANKQLWDQLKGAGNLMDAQRAVETFNAANGTDFSPEAGRAVWQEVNKSALEPGMEWGDFGSLPVGAQRRVSDDAGVLAGTALLQAEEAIAKWHANNQPKEGEEPKSWDPYEIAQTLILNKNKGFIMSGQAGAYDQAVADRMLFELERLRQNEREEEDDGEEKDEYMPLQPTNAPGAGG